MYIALLISLLIKFVLSEASVDEIFVVKKYKVRVC